MSGHIYQGVLRWAASSAAHRGFYLKRDLYPELDLSLICEGSSHLPEICIPQGLIRIVDVEVWCVAKVKELGPELSAHSLSYPELTEE